MEMASQLMPIILCLLLSILVIVIIVFFCKLNRTVDKANIVLDDVYHKVKKMDNLFSIIDRSADALNTVTDKITSVVSNSIMKVFKRKRKKRKDDYDYE